MLWFVQSHPTFVSLPKAYSFCLFTTTNSNQHWKQSKLNTFNQKQLCYKDNKSQCQSKLSKLRGTDFHDIIFFFFAVSMYKPGCICRYESFHVCDPNFSSAGVVVLTTALISISDLFLSLQIFHSLSPWRHSLTSHSFGENVSLHKGFAQLNTKLTSLVFHSHMLSFATTHKAGFIILGPRCVCTKHLPTDVQEKAFICFDQK